MRSSFSAEPPGQPRCAGRSLHSPAGPRNHGRRFTMRWRTCCPRTLSLPAAAPTSRTTTRHRYGRFASRDSFSFPQALRPSATVCRLRSVRSLPPPERAVATVIGDGTFVFSAQELLTASDLGLGIPVVVVDNNGFGRDPRPHGRVRHRTRRRRPRAARSASVRPRLSCRGCRIASGCELAAALVRPIPTVLAVTAPAASGM